MPVSQREIKRWQIQDRIRPRVRITYNKDIVEHLDFEHQSYDANFAHRKWLDMGGLIPAPTTVDEAVARQAEINGHDLIYRRSPQEAAARHKRIYGSARYKPRQGEMTRVEYKAQMERDEAARKLEPFAGKPKKRRAGPGCRYKPAAPKWKPGLRDVDTAFRGSFWSA